MRNFINRCLAEGAAMVSRNDQAYMPIPPVPHRPWEVGCLIHISEDSVIMLEVIRASENKCQAPFMVVEVTFPDGYTAIDKAYLPVFTKMIRPSGSKNLVTTKGTAVDFIHSFHNWGEAFEALRGKILKVTADDIYEQISPDGTLRHVHIYGFDLYA